MNKQELAHQKRLRRSARKNPSKYSTWNITPEADSFRQRYALFRFPHEDLRSDERKILDDEIRTDILENGTTFDNLSTENQNELINQIKPVDQQDGPAESS